jgi:hypothetical protein
VGSAWQENNDQRRIRSNDQEYSEHGSPHNEIISDHYGRYGVAGTITMIANLAIKVILK